MKISLVVNLKNKTRQRKKIVICRPKYLPLLKTERKHIHMKNDNICFQIIYSLCFISMLQLPLCVSLFDIVFSPSLSNRAPWQMSVTTRAWWWWGWGRLLSVRDSLNKCREKTKRTLPGRSTSGTISAPACGYKMNTCVRL